MKNLKKVLAFAIVCCMMLSVAVSAAAPFPDVDENASYAEAVTTLKALKVMVGDEEGNFNPTKPITRAEAAATIIRALGMESAAQASYGNAVFTDVASDHWASGYIAVASQSKIINGYGANLFGPGDDVTYEQMVKMVVSAMGYAPQAESAGGFPAGYLVTASTLKVTTGTSGTGSEPAVRSTVARLVYNALDKPVMKQTNFTPGNEEYTATKVEDEDTLLTRRGIDKYEGVITGVSYATGSTTRKGNQVTLAYTRRNGVSAIDSPSYFVGETNAIAMLGYSVVAYVSEDEVTANETILAIAAQSGRNETLEIDYSQIKSSTKAGGVLTEATYTARPTDKSDTKLEFDSACKFYYNGGEEAGEVADFFEDAYTVNYTPGKVLLIDSRGNDGIYDFVFVTAYEGTSYVVKETTSTRIVDKDNNTISDVDLDDEDTIYSFFLADGTPAEFSDIEAENIITIVEGTTKDNVTIITVYISKNVVEGTVTEKGTDDKGEYYTIGGNVYRLGDGISVNVGDSGKFYLDVDNRIVRKDAMTGRDLDGYAYLIDAAVVTGGFEATIELKFITAAGTVKRMELASRLTIEQDGSTKTIDSAKNDTSSGGSGRVIAGALGGNTNYLYTVEMNNIEATWDWSNQLFKYQVNSSGQINKVFILGSLKNDESSFTQDYNTVSGAIYNSVNETLGGLVVSKDVAVISVNTTKAKLEEGYSVSTVGNVLTNGKTYTKVSAYDIVGDYPTVIVIEDSESTFFDDTKFLVISRIAKTNNERNYPIDKIYGFQGGQSVEVETSEEEVKYFGRNGNELDAPPTISNGDVVIFTLDGKGAIDKIKLLMTADEARAIIDTVIEDENYTGGLYVVNQDDDGVDVVDAFGFVSAKGGSNRLTLDIGGGGGGIGNTSFVFASAAKATIYEVNLNRTASTNRIQTISFGDIAANVTKGERLGYWVYLRTYDSIVVDAVAYCITNPEGGLVFTTTP